MSHWEKAFPNRKDVVFYFGPKLEASQMRLVYQSLEQSTFPTLYAATHPADDFAESFASYVHVVMMGRDYEVRTSTRAATSGRSAPAGACRGAPTSAPRWRACWVAGHALGCCGSRAAA